MHSVTDLYSCLSSSCPCFSRGPKAFMISNTSFSSFNRLQQWINMQPYHKFLTSHSSLLLDSFCILNHVLFVTQIQACLPLATPSEITSTPTPSTPLVLGLHLHQSSSTKAQSPYKSLKLSSVRVLHLNATPEQWSLSIQALW